MIKISKRGKLVSLIAVLFIALAMAFGNAPLAALADEQTDVLFDRNDIVKVVNVTDYSYCLSDNEYAIENGKLVIDGGYLYTLEAGTTYVFRVVTTDGQYDIEVLNDLTSPTLTADAESYERGERITLKLSENVVIYAAELDGTEVEYTREGNSIILSKDVFTQMIAGEHTVKLFTSRGRPSATFTLNGQPDDVWEEIVPINYIWFILDMSIFGGAIVVYVVFVAIKKSNKKRIKNKG